MAYLRAEHEIRRWQACGALSLDPGQGQSCMCVGSCATCRLLLLMLLYASAQTLLPGWLLHRFWLGMLRAWKLVCSSKGQGRGSGALLGEHRPSSTMLEPAGLLHGAGTSLL